jgi:CHASE2 domain-containing sensor protein
MTANERTRSAWAGIVSVIGNSLKKRIDLINIIVILPLFVLSFYFATNSNWDGAISIFLAMLVLQGFIWSIAKK